ncbi:MAG: cupin domain-containing protein [Cellulosilyticum sp.]|nr:cupin domain-containing protein [Cellulosilyticum sp.]
MHPYSSNKANTAHGYTLPGANRYKGRYSNQRAEQQISDYGPYPFATNMEQVTKSNQNFRTALWTGDNLQITLMSLLPGEDIGLEQHNDLDQFIRIEQGKGMVMMGDSPDNPNFQQMVYEDYAFIIPAGKWHNLTNVGSIPLKLYSIYAPVQHPYGTVHPTKADAEKAEAENQ